MKVKEEFTKIRVPILNKEYAVWVLIGNKEKAIKFLKNHFDDGAFYLEDFEQVRGKTFNRKDYMPVIWIGIHDHFMATLAHEAVHACNFIWDYIDEPSKNEIFAQSVGAIVYSVENLLKKI